MRSTARTRSHREIRKNATSPTSPDLETRSVHPVGQAPSCVRTASFRAKYYDRARLDGAPAAFPGGAINARGYPDSRYTLQVYVEDCTAAACASTRLPGARPPMIPQASQYAPRLAHLEADAAASRFSSHYPGRIGLGSISPTCAGAVHAAAVRVPGRVRRLRRDALPEAPLAAVRRSAADRQRHGMFVDSTAATCRPRPGAPVRTAAVPPGRIPVRGQCGIRLRLSPGDRQADSNRRRSRQKARVGAR